MTATIGSAAGSRFCRFCAAFLARHGSCSSRLVPTREDEFDRCVTDLGLRAARERIREREERCEGQMAFSGMAAEKKPLDRILELRRADARRRRLGLAAQELL